jgi:hypothetical protein
MQEQTVDQLDQTDQQDTQTDAPADSQTAPEAEHPQRPVFKVHYSRPTINRGKGSLYLYGPRTESNARKTALKRLPEDSSVLFVETLDVVTARLGMRFGLSLKDVLCPDDYRTLLGDLARVQGPVKPPRENRPLSK